jgi:enterochelin esterase-like enzyme
VANGHPSSQVAVYLPPGYGTSTRRYPVVYEVPWSYDNWVRAIGIGGMLDQLISSGQIPPLIMVFAAHYGAPIPDTECVDSHDGRQWLETFFTKTVVGYVDSNFRTIATPAARAIFGYSEGAYCSSMLAFRHPDVFSSAISMSGYFQAAIRTPVTVNAPLPFGGDQQAIVDHSPLHLASTLSTAQRDAMFFVLSADPREWLYGPQYEAMAAVLRQEHYHFLLLPTQLGHACQATRVTLPPALHAVAARWVATGVFAGQS